jgi:hypothetical protein
VIFLTSEKFQANRADDESFIRPAAFLGDVIYQELEKGLKIISLPDVGGVCFFLSTARDSMEKQTRSNTKLIRRLTLNPLGVLFVIAEDFLRTSLKSCTIIRLHNVSRGSEELVSRYLDSTNVSGLLYLTRVESI